MGCNACHKIEETPLAVFQDQPDKPSKRSRYLEEFAPTLAGVGSKMNKAWLYAWVRNPKLHFKDSSMPNLRLSEQEATDVVEYLMTLKKPEWEKLAAPQANPKIVDDLIIELLKKVMSDHDAEETIAGKNPRAEYKDLATPDGKVKWLGRKMVKNFGCYSCHQLKDDPDTGMKWQDEEGIGVELTGSQPWGSKHHDKLDFGFAAHDGVNHHGVKAVHQFTGDSLEAHVAESRASWLENKLANPRVFDAGKMASKPWDELLRMPHFGLNKKEIELLSTFVLSFTDHTVAGLVDGAKMRPNTEQMAKYRGDRIARDNNCRACHRLSLDTFFIEWKRRESGKEKKTVGHGRGPLRPRGAGGRHREQPAPLEAARREGRPEGERKEALHLQLDHGPLDARHAGHDPRDEAGSGRVARRQSRLEVHLLRRERRAGTSTSWAGRSSTSGRSNGTIRRTAATTSPSSASSRRTSTRPTSRTTRRPRSRHATSWTVSNESEFESRYAPMLRSQGVKTQTDWLFKFLRAPYPIRPTLQPIYPGAKALPDVNLRMPTFDFSDEEANSLVKWFAVRDQMPGVDSFPSTEFPERVGGLPEGAQRRRIEKADKIVKDTNTGCASCHYMAGAAPPGVVLKHAPDLARVEDRLRPRWMYHWQADPSGIYPGTTMTQYDFKPIFGGNQQDGVNAAVEHAPELPEIQQECFE